MVLACQLLIDLPKDSCSNVSFDISESGRKMLLMKALAMPYFSAGFENHSSVGIVTTYSSSLSYLALYILTNGMWLETKHGKFWQTTNSAHLSAVFSNQASRIDV